MCPIWLFTKLVDDQHMALLTEGESGSALSSINIALLTEGQGSSVQQPWALRRKPLRG